MSKSKKDQEALTAAEYKRINDALEKLEGQISVLERRTDFTKSAELELKKEKRDALNQLKQLPSLIEALEEFLAKYPAGCRVMEGTFSTTASIFNDLRKRHGFGKTEAVTPKKERKPNRTPDALEYDVTFDQTFFQAQAPTKTNSPKVEVATGTTPVGFFNSAQRKKLDAYRLKLETELGKLEFAVTNKELLQREQKEAKLETIKAVQVVYEHYQLKTIISRLEAEDPQEVLVGLRCKSLLNGLLKDTAPKETSSHQQQSESEANLGHWSYL